MKYKKPFFEECREWWWGGWYIKVRDENTYRITRQHLTDNLRKKYEEDFGEDIINEEEFNEWYLNNLMKK